MFVICPECHGTRTIRIPTMDSECNWHDEERNCPNCHGAGEVYDPKSAFGDEKDKSIG